VQIQLADIQKSWEEEKKLRKESEDALVLLHDLLPDEQLKKAKERLAKGDKEAAEKAFDAVADKENEAVALAAHQSGKLAQDRLDYEKAMRRYKEAVMLAKDNPEYLFAAGKMAWTIADYTQAQDLLEKLLKIREAEGKEDLELALALNELAELYRSQGKYAEAEPLLQRALAIWEQKLGKDHPDVAET
jgi:tetratricopeptide (TPR) repeat protein